MIGTPGSRLSLRCGNVRDIRGHESQEEMDEDLKRVRNFPEIAHDLKNMTCDNE
jgi:hypothetical protein